MSKLLRPLLCFQRRPTNDTRKCIFHNYHRVDPSNEKPLLKKTPPGDQQCGRGVLEKNEPDPDRLFSPFTLPVHLQYLAALLPLGDSDNRCVWCCLFPCPCLLRSPIFSIQPTTIFPLQTPLLSQQSPSQSLANLRRYHLR